MKNFVEKYFKAHHVVILIYVLLGLFFAVALGLAYCYFGYFQLRRLKEQRRAVKAAYYRRILSGELEHGDCYSSASESPDVSVCEHEHSQVIQNNVAVQTEIEGITSLLAYSITADWESDDDENFDDIDITVTAENVMSVDAKKKKNEPATCAICKETDSLPHNSILHKEVAERMNDNAVAKGLENPHLKQNDIVHIKCRKVLERDDNRHGKMAGDAGPSHDRSSRSSEPTFDFKNCCLYCGLGKTNHGTIDARNRDKIRYVRTLIKQNAIQRTIERRNDSWALKVKGRVNNMIDLPAADAWYHVYCNSYFEMGCPMPQYASSEDQPPSKRGRKELDEQMLAFQASVDDFFDSEVSQMTVADFIQSMKSKLGEGSEPYSHRHCKRLLESMLGDEVRIDHGLITLKDMTPVILRKFHNTSEQQPHDIVNTAGKLIVEELKQCTFFKVQDYYPSFDSESFLQSLNAGNESVPLLYRLLKHMISSKSHRECRITSIIHAIVHANKPRTSLPVLQLGLAVQLHHTEGTRRVIEQLYRMGFSASYTQAKDYERSSAVSFQGIASFFIEDRFLQHSADNVDYVPDTMYGDNSIHCMGILGIVTPGCSMGSIPIKKGPVDTAKILELTKNNIYYLDRDIDQSKLFVGEKYSKLSKITYPDRVLENIDLIHFFALSIRSLKVKSTLWSGYMQAGYSSGDHPGVSSFIFLPMIDLPPTDMNCIYSTLKFVKKQSDSVGKRPVLTFDQPLYLKALQITLCEESGLSDIVLKLGSFHNGMTFLCTIGDAMANTGLKECIQTMYSENSTKSILKGKAYVKAIRAYTVVYSALFRLLIEETEDLSDDEKALLKVTYEQLLDTKEIGPEILDLPLNKSLCERLRKIRFVSALQNGGQRGETMKLWLQFMDMFELMLNLVRNDRVGSFLGQLYYLEKMLPFFASTGHNLYFTTGWLFLQTMNSLKDQDPELWQDLCADKYTCRKTNRKWAGIPADQTIEQTLMRPLKSHGGYAERGEFSESQRNVWLYSLNFCALVNSTMQSFVDYKSYTSEQHRDITETRLPKNEEDLKAVYMFLKSRNPCLITVDGVMNIVSGVVGSSKVNIQNARDIGEKIMQNMEGQLVLDYKFSRKEQAITMASEIVTKKDGTKTIIDPQQIFMRLIAMASLLKDTLPQESMENISTKVMLRYELCPYPPALFETENKMLQATKPDLAEGIRKAGEYKPVKLKKKEYQTRGEVVIDGGGLLHFIPWAANSKFEDIFESYSKFIKGNLATQSATTVIFDSYPEYPTTKDSVHAVRYPTASLYVNIRPDAVLDVKKDVFLTNYKNKQSFVNKLRVSLQNAGVVTLAAEHDADRDVVTTALQKLQHTDVTIFGDDTDLIVLILHHHEMVLQSGHILFYHSKSELWNMNEAITKLQGKKFLSRILAVHALLGCDTTSRINGFGKGRLCKLNDETLWSSMDELLKPNQSPELVELSCKAVLLRLYGARNEQTLNELRFKLFCKKKLKKLTDSQLKNSQQMADCKTLPPTDEAAKYHSRRVYHQVQYWIGNELNALEWGWKEASGRYDPIMTAEDVRIAPDAVLDLVNCACKSGCTSRKCSCKRFELPCTLACVNCQGQNCNNTG